MQQHGFKSHNAEEGGWRIKRRKVELAAEPQPPYLTPIASDKLSSPTVARGRRRLASSGNSRPGDLRRIDEPARSLASVASLDERRRLIAASRPWRHRKVTYWASLSAMITAFTLAPADLVHEPELDAWSGIENQRSILRDEQADDVDPATSSTEASRPAVGSRQSSALAGAQGGPKIILVKAIPSTQTPKATSPGFWIQIAATHEEVDARHAWQRSLREFGALLTGMEPHIERAETENGLFYRVQVGSFADRGRAEGLCAELKEREATCFIVAR